MNDKTEATLDAGMLYHAARGYLTVASFRRSQYPLLAAALIERAATLLALRRCPLSAAVPEVCADDAG